MLRKAFLLLLALILFPSISHAEIKTYTHTVKQAFGGSQSPDDARIAAIAKAKREALEKAGTYLESLTIVKNSMVEKDEILALAAGVLKAEVISQRNYATEDAFGIIVIVKVDVDTSILEERVKKLLQDRGLLEKYQRIKKREKELLAKIAVLEEKYRKLQNLSEQSQTQKREAIKDQFHETAQKLTAVALQQKAIGLVTEEKHDPDQALELLTQAIRLDPYYAEAYWFRGVVYDEIGKHKLAMEDYNQALKLQPSFALGYSSRGFAYIELGKYQHATDDCNTALYLNQKHAFRYNLKDAIAYFCLGIVYGRLDDQQRAIENYNKAIRLNPNFAKAYINRGLTYDDLGKHQKAIEDFSQAIRLKPNNAKAYYERGLAYNYSGKDQQAIEDYGKAINLDPNYVMAYNNRGFTYLSHGKHQKAIEDFSQAIRLDPNNAKVYINRGLAYDNLGQIEQACDDWQKACVLGNCSAIRLIKKKGVCR